MGAPVRAEASAWLSPFPPAERCSKFAEQGLARVREAPDALHAVDGRVAEDEDAPQPRALRAAAMKARSRSGSTSFHQPPSCFRALATMTASA